MSIRCEDLEKLETLLTEIDDVRTQGSNFAFQAVLSSTNLDDKTQTQLMRMHERVAQSCENSFLETKMALLELRRILGQCETHESPFVRAIRDLTLHAVPHKPRGRPRNPSPRKPPATSRNPSPRKHRPNP